ncbi:MULTISPECIES: DUF2142 domain-containing protein [Paenibacillus]|uniref:DUF2142 domain-containing protein n=1 Tax=Paenibacillus odorifer TaxID=189426 RepID=A0A1R0Y2C5_9BACL|nr:MULTISPECIES: DUF2142 domain-containing protein [Paenibacillus]AIQ38143.1 hypothetical protein R50345_28200 [Paenibacillus sp. FSL R5-0345]OMD41504.1 hypothetical protein BSK52_11450 [Paenibacillus odorifer]
METFVHRKELWNFLSKRLFIILFILISAIYFSIVIFEHKDFFITISQDKKMIISQENSGDIIGEIQDGTLIKQKFEVNDKTNLEIAIPFGTFERINTGELIFDIKENGQLLHQEILDVSSLSDGQNITMKIPNSDQKYRKLEFLISSKGLYEGNSVTLWKSRDNNVGYLTVNDQEQQGSIYFNLSGISTKALMSAKSFYLLLVAFTVFFIAIIIVVIRLRDNIAKVFVVLSLSIGIIMVFLFPPFDHLDELEHYYRAYEVSEGKFINQTVDGQIGNYIPYSLISTVDKVRYIHQTGFQYKIVDEAFSMKLNPDERTFYRNYASIYSPVLYIPQALGIIVSRVFNAAPITMLYLGRLFNFLAYISIIYFSLKIVPFKKMLILIIALLPMSLIQASSLSADAVIIASSILFISIILKLTYTKEVSKITTKDICLLVLVGMFMSISKPVYVPLLLLIFIIPYQKFGAKKNYFKKIFLILTCCTLPMIIWNLMSLTNIAVPDLRGGESVSPSDQVHFVLTHPFRYIKVIFDTFLNLGSQQFLAMLGKTVTNYGYGLSPVLIFGFIFLLFFMAIPNRSYLEEERMQVKVSQKIIFMAIISCVLVLTYTALYTGFTPVGGSIINGIQGRYFLPVSPLFFLLFASSSVIIKDKKIDKYLMMSLCVLLFSLLLNYILKVNGVIPF